MEGNELQRLSYRGLLRKIFFFAVLVLASFSPCLAFGEELDSESCLACHESDVPLVDPKVLSGSVHNSLQCTDCHSSITEIPHDQVPSKADSRSEIHWANTPVMCGKCHENILQVYKQSVHGRAVAAGKKDAPVCIDCHGAHAIKSHFDPSSSVYTTVVSQKTCGHCHGAEKIASKYRLPSDRLKTYLESYHGLASKYGITTVANCASCHGAHNILLSSDPHSSVNKKNLPQTCGQCHPHVGDQLAKGSVHLSPSWSRDRKVYWVMIFYIVLIVIVIGGMVIHNLLDFLSKLRLHYLEKKTEGMVLRFTTGERIQHWILFISFTMLAYTGFALKYPEAWWALPFTVMGNHFDWRGVIHRAMAIVFCLLCFYHVWFLLATARGRDQLKALLPLKKDFKDLLGMIRYNLGLSSQRPKLGRYGYVEKAEYWALLWGSAIMVLTGGLLTFENWTMRHFPKWLLDIAITVHFYEAVLATLAIFVWHLYFTIFDPDYYPMNWSMTTGKSGHSDEDHSKDGKGSEDV